MLCRYVSYEHPDCTLWPPLDDGSPVPARITFTDIHWDPQRRIFRGVIDWENHRALQRRRRVLVTAAGGGGDEGAGSAGAAREGSTVSRMSDVGIPDTDMSAGVAEEDGGAAEEDGAGGAEEPSLSGGSTDIGARTSASPQSAEDADVGRGRGL